MSNINPNNIDGTFPIAGQDNSSQGFRDNFTNIRNNFSYAQSELSDLQAKAIVSSALNGQTLTNDMAYNALYRPELSSASYNYQDQGTVSGSATVTLNYATANFQKFTTNGTNTLSFSNWPTSATQVARFVLWVHVANYLTDTVVLPSNVTIGLNDIAGMNTATSTITFDYNGDYFFEFVTPGGATISSGISIRDLSRNYATLRDPNFYWDDAIANTLMIGFGQNQTSFQTAYAIEAGNDAVSAQGSYNSVSVGNIFLANINNPMFDTGQSSGYSITGFRGNLQTATLNPVSNNDFLGYVNSITYTGSPTEVNSFQQLASIGFYATGSNALGGLGGNIGIFTHAPVTTGNVVLQAVGIENDQSTKFYGNVTHSAGFVDQGYQFVVPTVGFWSNVSPGKSRIIFNPAGTLATGGVTLPNTNWYNNCWYSNNYFCRYWYGLLLPSNRK
jgi:hypothetical protein